MTTPCTPAFLIATLVCGLATPATPAIAQTGSSVLGRAGAAIQDIGGVVAALTTQVVRAEPYSADAVTTVSQVLADGTRIDRTVRARVFRDGEGRTRREQTVLGLSSLSPSSDALRIVTITDPVAGVVSTLDEPTRTVRQRRFEFFGGAPRLAVPDSSQADTQFAQQQADRAKQVTLEAQRLRALSETLTQLGIPQAPSAAGRGETRETSSLGTRQVEGIQVTGRRTTQTIPTGQIGNDRPIVITDDTWESAELHLLVSSRHSDPRTGTVAYRLVNIVRGEPSPDLFKVPAGYAVIGEAPRTDTNAPNARPGQ